MCIRDRYQRRVHGEIIFLKEMTDIISGEDENFGQDVSRNLSSHRRLTEQGPDPSRYAKTVPDLPNRSHVSSSGCGVSTTKRNRPHQQTLDQIVDLKEKPVLTEFPLSIEEVMNMPGVTAADNKPEVTIRTIPARVVITSISLFFCGLTLLVVALVLYLEDLDEYGIYFFVFGGVAFILGTFYSCEVYHAMITPDKKKYNEIIDDMPFSQTSHFIQPSHQKRCQNNLPRQAYKAFWSLTPIRALSLIHI
eukprot:TRINITY_DN8778_c0_g2_i2.p1 TRINITY_DN8778_c0_g2~~TRINITY_DN8778_c0_g2_i2.p1  ORF type:complete len:249 (-),score=18.46 TRINITY_DN8778_c0_g2_i2:61-807(-)